MTTETKAGFWGILEVMGHRRLAGLISEGVFAGEPVIQIEVLADFEAQVARLENILADPSQHPGWWERQARSAIDNARKMIDQVGGR